MTTLALGVAGAAVGSFAGPLGASIGWSLGAFAGNALFGKGQHGPRLSDLKAQNSAYGQPIPIGYATIRIAGNVIWSTDLIETKHKSSGKGGPKVTSYSYAASFAVGLLETSFIDGNGDLVNNPIVGILRIWADGRLIYGEGSDGTSLPMTVYYGTEDQEADPTMEAEEGAGNVPAHRGMAYVVFDNLQLASFGNRIPNLTFEVVASGAMGLEFYAEWPVDWSWGVDGEAYSYPYTLNGVENTADGLILHRYRNGQIYGSSMGTSDDDKFYYDRRVYDLKGNLISTDTQVVTDLSATILALYGSLNSGLAYVWWASGTEGAWFKDGVITQSNTNPSPVEAAPIYWNGYAYAAGDLDGDMKLRRWNAADGSVYSEIFDDVSFNADEQRTGYPASLGWFADAGELSIGDDGYIYWVVGYHSGSDDGTRLFKLDADLNLISSWWTGDGAVLTSGGTQGGGAAIYRNHIIAYKSSGIFDTIHNVFMLHRLNDDGTTTFVDEIVAPPLYDDAMVGLATSSVYYIGGGLAAVRQGILRLGSTGTTWGEIVENVSQHVGFATDEIDVSELTDPVRGYVIANRMTGRAAIEAGMPAYQHGAVESNLQVKFPKWGKEPVATITADDLGARPSEDDPPDPIKITHQDDKQLPRRIEVVFNNYDMEYQEGHQYSPRTTVGSDTDIAVTIPIVLVDAEAKTMAEVILYNGWIERDKFSFPLPRKWSHLEPTDVIDLNGKPVRITSKEEVGYTHMQCEGVGTAVGVFITGPVASPPIGFVHQVPPTLNRTDLLLIDAPMVEDTDPQIGFKAAMAGRLEGAWPGATLLKSSDGGVNYGDILAVVDRDTFGITTTTLGDFGGGNIFDETNTVTVRLTPGSGELSSSNRLGILNGANKALLGDEVIQFRDATLVAARTYTLSGLRRGRRGTEWAIADHGSDEDFILLPCHNVETAFSELGKSRLYKAVSSGGLLASASATTFTNNGRSLKCYAPCHLGGGRNAAGDIIINWRRRARVGGAWLDSIDVPLNEDTEYYQLNFYSASYAALLFSAFSSTTTYTLDAADQTTNYGGLVSPLYVGIQQVGSYGLGYEARAAI